MGREGGKRVKSYYIVRTEFDFRPAIADLSWAGEFNAWLIHRINVPSPARGKGYGRAVLRDICADADAEGVPLILAPESSGGLEQKELVAWYRRHGFEWTRSGMILYREPLNLLVWR